jgi:hypothetical protein
VEIVKKSTNYTAPDSGGWMHVCDDLFLAQFRGRPCAICGAERSFFRNKTIRSMGHHLLSKELHRRYRYWSDNIIVLCPKHHLGADMSPHSHDGAAQAVFYDWLKTEKGWQWHQMVELRFDKFNKEWTYRDMYEKLGGEILKDGPKKYWKPKNHAKAIREAEAK